MTAVALCAWPQWHDASLVSLGGERLRDDFLAWQASDTPEQRVLVVDIDESSLLRYPWPWPRARLAALVEDLLADGARAVALDILQEKPADPDGDARMAMLAKHGPLVIAQMFDYERRDPALRVGALSAGMPAQAAGTRAMATGYIGNNEALAASAVHAGNIGILPDTDGVLRRLPMNTYFEGHSYPTLSSALLRCCAAQPPGDAGFVRIPYRRNWDVYTVAKAAELLDHQIDASLIKDRLVLIGSSSLSIGDRVSTPLGPSTAGLLVHAAMLTEQLDRRDGLGVPAWPGKWIAVLFTLAVVLLTAYTLPRLSAATNTALLAGTAVLWLALAYLITPHDQDFSPAAPLLSNLFLLALAVPFHWQLAQYKSRQLLGTLRQYVAREVVDELLRRDLKDPLSPRLLQVTTLIADMEGYTGQVETLALEEAALLTTDFLDCLTRPVLEKRGTLDKYTGDGLVAFWGAPLPNDDHADLALDAAQLILREVAELSASRVAAGHAPLRVRIGIESGAAMAGDYGTAFRSIYTAVGDSVNTASRLEQAARDVAHDVIVGEGTFGMARRHRFIDLGERQLRGKEKSIHIYTLEPQP